MHSGGSGPRHEEGVHSGGSGPRHEVGVHSGGSGPRHEEGVHSGGSGPWHVFCLLGICGHFLKCSLEKLWLEAVKGLTKSLLRPC